tara:strand:+ start:12303 stop:12434 length:132 start_codon:yes stop_codon:yes gene_type:complete
MLYPEPLLLTERVDTPRAKKSRFSLTWLAIDLLAFGVIILFFA